MLTNAYLVQDIDIKQTHFDTQYYQAIGYHRRAGMAFQKKDGTPTCSELESWIKTTLFRSTRTQNICAPKLHNKYNNSITTKYDHTRDSNEVNMAKYL